MGGMKDIKEAVARGEPVTGNDAADQLLRDDPNALLIAVLLDQQVQASLAFEGPYKIKNRLGHLNLEKLAAMDLETLQEHFGESPAVHRFYNKMAGSVQELAQVLVSEYDGQASNLWADADTWDVVASRVGDLPGFGKSKIATLRGALELFGYKGAALA